MIVKFSRWFASAQNAQKNKYFSRDNGLNSRFVRGTGQEKTSTAIHRTQKKRSSFSRTRKNFDSDTSYAEKAYFFFKDKKKLRQRYIARRKSVLLFQGQEKTSTAIHRTQKKCTSFSRIGKTTAVIHRGFSRAPANLAFDLLFK
ncbi:hypothetical protein [Virgibacillus proomii]|uniref:hypothetical protein n=1 Tax=Virgibacillus proomii TaxID=84407 RepID=UPI001C105227|nr:hypothetical protein [Virgibacillus proomii]MBU5265326.1 hypothetical protein [Virgibacillus proomii]